MFATAAWLILLGVLGMAPLPTLPINDKALHFFGVRLSVIPPLTSLDKVMLSWALRLSSYTSLSTSQSTLMACHAVWKLRIFYRGPARRVWYIRRAPLLLTLITSFLFGGIISEFVQSALPVRQGLFISTQG